MKALDAAVPSARPASVDGRGTLEPVPVANGRGYLVAKRVLDVALASAGLVLFSPVWSLIAIAIKVGSRGPVLYRTASLGLDATPFMLYKFRTMIEEADEGVHRDWIEAYVKRDEPFAVEGEGRATRRIYKVVNDPRVTPLGRVLRRTGLDEVPQFLNVLRGEMSVVGPRSPRPFEYEHYDERAKQRVRVIPGITGLYQVTARSTATFTEMVALDLEYARRRTVGLDLWIMLRTIPVMVFMRGGY